MNGGRDLLTAISAMMGCVGFVTCQLWWIKGKGLSGLAGAGGGDHHIFRQKGGLWGQEKIFLRQVLSLISGT